MTAAPFSKPGGAQIGDLIASVEALEDVPIDLALAADLLERGETWRERPFQAATPSHITYGSDEIEGCRPGSYPAFSITGPVCALNCEHCRAGILAPMIPATDPATLDRQVREFAARGNLRGFLLSGGSNRRNEVPFDRYLPTVARLKADLPHLRIAAHTGLVSRARAEAMAESGIDVAMMDVIGDAATIREVYHLDRPVEDFEQSLANLCETAMEIVPHIVIGLHFGRMRGEGRALEIIAAHKTQGCILVVLMPQHAMLGRFDAPDPEQAGAFFGEARSALSDRAVKLGCARPFGRIRQAIDIYGMLAGLDAVAYPSPGVVALARLLGRPVEQHHACCALGRQKVANGLPV